MAFSCKDDDMSKDGLMSIEAAPLPLKFKNKIVEKMFDSIFNFEIISILCILCLFSNFTFFIYNFISSTLVFNFNLVTTFGPIHVLT